MLKVALRAHEGWVDPVRMSARIGARRAAIVAGLRWLEAMGKVILRYERGGLRAYEPNRAPPEMEPAPSNGNPARGRGRPARRQASAGAAGGALAPGRDQGLSPCLC